MDESSSQSKRRRNKPILSCSFCRSRKLRCDRQSPCSACVRRGKDTECTYTYSEQERKDAVDYRPHSRNRQTRERIARLEHLVIEMGKMEQSYVLPNNTGSRSAAPNDDQPSFPTDKSQVLAEMGSLDLNDHHTVYTGSSHWVAILDQIQQLKDELPEEYSPKAETPESEPLDDLISGVPLAKLSLFNNGLCLPKEQILAVVPPRKVVDRHVSQFFNNFDLAPFLLHRNKFFAEYASFWENPSAVPIMWLGLLFSVLSMTTFMQQQQDIGPLRETDKQSQAMFDSYRRMTIQCLVAGDYLRPGRYTLETLILHFGVETQINFDSSTENWVLIGVIIRIALRMGLHRDPSHWPNIRPLQAEFRRRIWMILYQMDFFSSTQVGLPRIVQDSQCDTRPPAHLFDNDLGFEDDQIPPERPLTNSTALLHIIQRNSIIKVAAEIYDATEAGPPSPDSVASLGAKLDRVIESIPSALKYRSLQASIVDNPVTILQQIFLDILVHKAVYLLQRRSFVKGYAGEENRKSNELCIKAALAILEHQQRMDEETQPGGLMFSIRWKVASSLNHEFLQATMMLCFALRRLSEQYDSTVHANGQTRRTDILEALTIAKGIWEKITDRSVEARRAARAIETVLQQEMSKSNLPTLANAEYAANVDFFNFSHDQPPASTQSLTNFDQISQQATPSYFGGFDYGQDTTLDPSFFPIDTDMFAFGDMIGDGMNDGHEPLQLGPNSHPGNIT